MIPGHRVEQTKEVFEKETLILADENPEEDGSRLSQETSVFLSLVQQLQDPSASRKSRLFSRFGRSLSVHTLCIWLHLPLVLLDEDNSRFGPDRPTTLDRRSRRSTAISKHRFRLDSVVYLVKCRGFCWGKLLP